MRETRSKRAGWRGRERERERKWLRETRWSLDEGMSWGRKRNWVIKWPSYSTFFTFVFVFSKFVTHCSLKMCHLQAVYVWRISICVKSPNARTHTHLTMRIWTMNMNTFVIQNWSIIFGNLQLKNDESISCIYSVCLSLAPFVCVWVCWCVVTSKLLRRW